MRILKFKLKILLLAFSGILLIACSFDKDQDMNKQVYKILTTSEWTDAKALGEIETALDRKDGFIHLSTAKQLTGTLAFYFEDFDSLVLLQINTQDFKDEIVFEKALPAGERTGEFPHLYGTLKVEKIKNKWEIKRNAFNLPDEIILEAENNL
jgi:uncharacterized protein (DUF952 family)